MTVTVDGDAYRGVFWKVLSFGLLVAGIALWFLRDSGPLRGTPRMDLIAVLISLMGTALAAYTILLTRSSDRSDHARRLRDFADQVDRVLKKSAQGYFPKSGNSISVEFRSAAAPGTAISQTLGEYYESLPNDRRRLIVLGDAGSGKTVAVTQLADHLLGNWSERQPVPVIVPMTNWNTDQRFPDWLAGELTDRRLVPSRAVAEELLERCSILPILDGLDEMDAPDTPVRESRALAAMTRINEDYNSTVGKAPLVVVCRRERYGTLSRKLRLTNATTVTLQPLDSRRQLQFLEAAELREPTGQWLPEWRRVAEALDWGRDGSGPRGLARVLRTPWRLALLTTVYTEADGYEPVRSPQELLSMPTHAVPDHLLGLYTRAATTSRKRRPPGVHFWESRDGDAAKVEAWLSKLALYLRENDGRRVGEHVVSGTDLVLHRLWLFEKKPLTPDAVLWMLTPMFSISATSRFGSRLSDTTYGLLTVLLTVQLGYFLSGGAYGVMPRRLEWRRLMEPGVRFFFLCACGGILAAVPLREHIMGGKRLDLDVATAVSYVLLLAVLCASRPVTEYPQSAIVHPRDPLRAEFRLGLATMLAASLALGAFLSQVFQSWWGYGYGAGIVGAPAFVFAARGCRRFLGFRLNTPGLPWRLALFLHWCTEAGLLRVEGLAYQFRHRELQDWLAARPQPS
ncbi:NACHT domain-containing protein [[Kitasatospora] papulosa]|uniref:NACHT domain-containing protein n=1 Tax=[Kitasatospora] papulosa TaxID=1464011 RepID=UPI003695FE12